MKFQLATLVDIPTIQDIAYKSWPIAYGKILSEEQLNYMLGKFYSIDAIASHINAGKQNFYIVKDEKNIVLGFFAIEHCYNLEKKTKLHKIYLFPEKQGSGIGKLIIDEIITQSKPFASTSIVLNVNRYNNALHFYKKLGFEIIQTINIEIGNGYLMEDFVMKLQI